MKILNSKGEPIVLNAREKRVADINQRKINALGYEINITTMTTIMKKVSEQKYFKITPSDFMPIRVGNGAWSTNLLTYLSYALADDFSKGILNQGGDNARLAQGNVGIQGISVPVKNWAKGIEWNIMELEQAFKAGNWDLITSKEKQRKMNFDLGIQKLFFLGLSGDSSCLGLLNQAGVAFNTTLITKPISSMTTGELKIFCATILDDYRTYSNRTAWPTHFVIPESDYLGLAAPVSADFPIKSVLEQLLETFRVMTNNKDFKILPLAYADAAYSGFGYQQYCLYNYEEESLRGDVPVAYTSTVANTFDGFSYRNVGYAQFTGVQAYRPLELRYYKY